jgi:hypothetical protein
MRGGVMDIINAELICEGKIDYCDRDYKLEYYLISAKQNKMPITTYGVKINLVKENDYTEHITIPDVMVSKESMIELINLLYNNLVTPVSAQDVIYDYIE